MVLAAVAPIGVVSGDSFARRFRRLRGVSGVGFDLCQDIPSFPWLGSLANPFDVTFDRPRNFLPRFIQAPKVAQCTCEIVPR